MKSKTLRVPQEIKDRVDTEVRRCVEIAERKYDRSFKFPNITYEVRGTCGGYAHSHENRIDLNSILLMENLRDFIEGEVSTVTHEFAHLVDFIVYPNQRRGRKRSIHGRSWKGVMRVLGIRNPKRCHKFNTTNSRVRRKAKAKHVYSCNNCGTQMTLGPKRHRKQQLGGDLYQTVYWMGGCAHAKRTGYTYIGMEGRAVEKPFRDRYPTPKPKAPKVGTKLDHAVQVVRSMPGQDRGFVITRIMNECGMSYAGAQTYYYKAKKV